MKKLSLDETWRLCISMWRWIAKMWREGTELTVNELKRLWLQKHTKDIPRNHCYFCEYVVARKHYKCKFCPGKKVDTDFHCAYKNYNWQNSPIAFYNKLVSLNRKRKKKK